MAATETELLAEESPWRAMGAGRDPARCGYTLISNYAHYFWRPYLGNVAFSVWELLVSYCYGKKDTAFPSVAHLSRMLTNSDNSRNRVKGRKGPSARLAPLARLRAEHLVADGPNEPGPRTRYIFRVVRELPLLRPEQVKTLSPALQRDHERWLFRYGVSTEAYQRAYQLPLPEPEGGAPGLITPGIAVFGEPPPGVAVPPPGAAETANKTHELDLPKQWWSKTQEEMKLQLSPGLYRTTVEQAHVIAFGEGVLTLRCRAPIVRELMQFRMHRVLLSELTRASVGAVRDVRYD